MVIDHFNTRPMQTGDGGDKAQPKPVAGHAAAAFKPIKASEHMLMFGDRNSRPVIGDRKHGAVTIMRDVYDHFAAFRAVFDRIVDEIGQRVEQEVHIPRDKRALIAGNAQTASSVFCGCIE